MKQHIHRGLALVCILALVPIFAFSHHPVSAQKPANTSSLASVFHCVKAPKITPPPDPLQHQAHRASIIVSSPATRLVMAALAAREK